jgi:3-demethoxyubiquinol 3-hydroxylase
LDPHPDHLSRPTRSGLPALSPRDRLLSLADEALRMLAGGATGRSAQRAGRPTPQPPAALASTEPDSAGRAVSAGLMRVNHAGEIAAQGLYHGQALVADGELRRHLQDAAREEGDHLAWCAERLAALGARPSLLDPLWYGGAVAMGAVAGLIGDRTSLGFIVETERQVEAHLAGHLERLPRSDVRSRAIVEQMRVDEVRHGADATGRGAVELPPPVRAAMRLTGKVMTTLAYRI